MAITIDWGNTFIISVPQADLNLLSGTLYELDTEVFRLVLKDLEDDEDGIVFPNTHRRNAPVTVAGQTYAQTLEILPPYSIEFEDGSYTVQLVGSNNNLFDVENGILVQNTVSVIPTNSAGLILVETAVSGLTPGETADLLLIKQMLAGGAEVSLDDKTVTVFDIDGLTPLATLDISTDGRIRIRLS